MATTKATTLAHTLGGISSDISTAEINRLDGVTGDLQTQLDAKAPLASPAFTGNTTIPDGGTIGSASDTDAITISSTGKVTTADSELNVKTTSHTFTVKGIDSAIGDSQSSTSPDTTDSDSGQFAVYNGATKLFGITEHGYVLKPNQPAFKAYLTADQNFSENSGYAKIQHNATNFNIGNHYDASTNYRFTAPVDGIYFFYGSVIMEALGSSTAYRISLRILKNNSTNKDSLTSGGPANTVHDDNEAQISGYIPMSAGDYAEMFVSTLGSDGTGNIWGDPSSTPWTSFSGHLVS